MTKLVYLGHASFLIESKNYSVVIDPYKKDSVPNLVFPQIKEVDAVICSHEHYDHNGRENVKISANPRPNQHLSIRVPHDHENGAKRGLNDINVFYVDGYKVVHLGDTGCVLDEKTLEPIKNCDVLLAPINGYFTIGPDELKTICKIVNPRILIPMHYYMEEYQSGYSDGNMIEKFKKLFPDYHYLNGEELDLDKTKDFEGVLIFNKYLQ